MNGIGDEGRHQYLQLSILCQSRVVLRQSRRIARLKHLGHNQKNQYPGAHPNHHASSKMTTYIPHLTLPTFVFSNQAASILLPVAAGTAVGFSTQPKATRNKYRELKQPPFRPPPWVFGPAWTLLYGLMGYAAYRAWMTGQNSIDPRKAALCRQGATLYTIQLGLNLIWVRRKYTFVVQDFD